MSDVILVPSGRFITDQERRKVCEMMWPGFPKEQEELKRRIVAAFNACRGLSMEALEAGSLKEVIACLQNQRDALLGALNLVVVDKDGDGFICREAMDEVREAIRLAEGGGA
jgi:hypothetical protein